LVFWFFTIITAETKYQNFAKIQNLQKFWFFTIITAETIDSISHIPKNQKFLYMPVFWFFGFLR